MYHIGINYYGHDSSCALFKNQKLIFAIEEERLTRIKHDGNIPLKSIEFITKKFNLTNKNVKSVNFATIPERLVFEKHINLYSKYQNKIDFFYDKRYQKKIKYLLNVRDELKKKIKFNCKFNFFHHHLCHQYSSYYLSGFNNAACFSFDGLGEIESTCFGYANKENIKIFDSINYPYSLGEVYTAITEYLGYKPESDEGTVMALSALGNEYEFIRGSNISCKKLFKKIIIIKNNKFKIDLSWFDYWCKRGEPRVSKKFVRYFGKPRIKGFKHTKIHKNIAAALQSRFEDAYIACLRELVKRTKEKNLVLSGGCALNCKANGKIEKKFNFKNIYIQPAAGDGGLSIGAAYLGLIGNNKNKKIYKKKQIDHTYFGPSFSNDYIKKILNKNKKKIIFQKKKNIEKYAAILLNEKKIIGWFQGRMEFGPRALGNRSIIADPRSKKMQKILNLKVKFRESFRPFAPSILEEYSKKIFNLKFESPFMLVATTLKNKKYANLAPGILHYDKTARVQTVKKKINMKFYKLISNFYKLTKIPMLLNTSFNGKGEPIVCTPQDSINCYLKNKLDYLIIGDFLIKKK